MNTRQFLTALLLVTLVFSFQAAARPTGEPVVIGHEIMIQSDVLDEERSILVSVPDTYDAVDKHYPVLYVLDGSAHFDYTSAMVDFLSSNDFIPEMIVVAINNSDRTRDMTPPSEEPLEQQYRPNHGGAENFQRFFTDDLMPWVEGNYRTHPYRVLIGHSFGGLFAIHTLTTNPDLFNAYIAISPSMQWNGQRLVGQAETFFTSKTELPITLYMTVGNETADLPGGIRKLSGVLESTAPKDFLWQFDRMPQETHNSVPHHSTYQGLEFVFANWTLRNPLEVYQQYGLEAVERFYANGDDRYKTDRGIPTQTLNPILVELVNTDRIDEAVSLMSSESASKNTVSPALNFLADALKEESDNERAAEFYRQAIKRYPGNTAAIAALDEMEIDYSDVLPNTPQANDQVLSSYSGVYSSQQTSDITVIVEDGKLYRELNGERSELLPFSENMYYLMGPQYWYQFQTNDTDEVRNVIISQGRNSFIAEKR